MNIFKVHLRAFNLLMHIILSKMKIFYAVFPKFLKPFPPKIFFHRTIFGRHYS